jgi:tetratricopeptide (TPR) repeat protein
MFSIHTQTFTGTYPLYSGNKPLLAFMKVQLTFALVMTCFISNSQDLAANSKVSYPNSLYARANESLSAGDTKNATGIFKQVIEFYESEGRVKEVPESYLGMALAFAFSGHYQESIRFHKKALRAHHRYRCGESDDSIRFNLGLAYQLAGKDRKARKLLEG